MINNSNLDNIDKQSASQEKGDDVVSPPKNISKSIQKINDFKSKLFKYPYLTSMLIAWAFIIIIIGICIGVGVGLI